VGHEGAGIVEAIGEKVTRVQPGDRIAIEPAVSCGYCDQCRAGRPHTCRNQLFLGCPGQMEGNLAEFIVMPEQQCLKLQAHQTIDDGATSEPLAIGLYAVKQAALTGHETIGILGFGPIGMSVFQMAKARGTERIFVSEKIEERIQMAEKQGAHWVGNPLRQHIARSVSETEPLLLDAVFECCGQQDAMDTAMDLLKPGGKLMVVGIPEFDRWSFPADVARRKEISIIHIRRQNHCAEETLEMLATGSIDGSAMITHRFRFDEVAMAFDLVAHYRDGVMKAMVDF
ncbi:MAG TPA: alcohol dehydrogenase catalytic domain-containing protein, partial [Prolixibacteraceae bacterium]|nr:alcohol dehydrogenase catalytic domain-containing protein [Prolixibacteraceae bacterium]